MFIYGFSAKTMIQVTFVTFPTRWRFDLFPLFLAGRRTERSYRSERRRDMSPCFFCGEDCSDCMMDEYEHSAAPRRRHNVLLTGLPAALLVICTVVLGM